MADGLGFVTAAIQLGVDAITVRPKRGIGQFVMHAVLKEVHTDELEITDQPVEQGGNISDHAFNRPASVIIEGCWSDSPPTGANLLTSLGGAVNGTIAGVTSILSGNSSGQSKDIYAKLLDLQASRQPFDVYTGKRPYKNMLIKSLIVTTDQKTENMLMVRAELRQILIATVTTATVSAPKQFLKNPSTSLPVLDKGTKALGNADMFNPLAGLRAGVVSSVSDIATSVSSSPAKF